MFYFLWMRFHERFLMFDVGWCCRVYVFVLLLKCYYFLPKCRCLCIFGFPLLSINAINLPGTTDEKCSCWLMRFGPFKGNKHSVWSPSSFCCTHQPDSVKLSLDKVAFTKSLLNQNMEICQFLCLHTQSLIFKIRFCKIQ